MRLCRLGGGAAPEGCHGYRRKKLIDVLVWQLDWGESYETIVRAAEAAGVPLMLLPCVATKPDLLDHLSFDWSAFRSLSSDRPAGFALGPILWSSIDRFAMRYGIDGDEFDRFMALMQAMDAAYREYHKKAD